MTAHHPDAPDSSFPSVVNTARDKAGAGVRQESAEAWLEAHVLDDECLGRAYEALVPRERTSLKLCIACLCDIWAERPAKETRTRLFRQGFGLREETGAVPWVLLACDPVAVSGPELLAAALPALLAGTPRLLPCFLLSPREAEPPAPLLAALELAGVERVFAAGEAAVAELLEELEAAAPGGRLVLLGGCGFGRQLALAAHARAVHSLCLVCSGKTAEPAVSGRARGVADDRAGLAGREDALNADDCALPADHEDALALVHVWPELTPEHFRRRVLRLFSS